VIIDNIDALIKSGDFPPVILLFGEENFLLEEAYNKLIKSICPDENSKYDLELFSATETDIEKVVSAASSYPFVSPRKVIVVKDFQKYFERGSKIGESSSFGRYLESPQPSTVLVLKASLPKFKGYSTNLKNPKKQAATEKQISKLKFPFHHLFNKYEWIEFPKIWEDKFPMWAKSRFRQAGINANEEACQVLVSSINPTLWDLKNEIDKLIIYLDDRKDLTAKDVYFIVGTNRSYNAFELQKAIGQKNMAKSIYILENILKDDKSKDVLILATMSRFFIILFKLLEESAGNNNNYVLAGKVGVFPNFVPEYLSAMRKFGPRGINQALLAIVEAEEKIKSTTINKLYLLTNLLIKIIDG
jgi:DNA polymerase III subunit delta